MLQILGRIYQEILIEPGMSDSKTDHNKEEKIMRQIDVSKFSVPLEFLALLLPRRLCDSRHLTFSKIKQKVTNGFYLNLSERLILSHGTFDYILVTIQITEGLWYLRPKVIDHKAKKPMLWNHRLYIYIYIHTTVFIIHINHHEFSHFLPGSLSSLTICTLFKMTASIHKYLQQIVPLWKGNA